MTAETALPLLLVATSLIPALMIFGLREQWAAARNALSLLGAVTKVALMAALLVGVARGETYEYRQAVLPDLDLVLRVEAIPLLFLTLSAFLWLITTVYAIGYLKTDARQSRFFGFFNLCVAATMGIGLAGNPFTFLVFYELLTVSTYPLVVHRGHEEALVGGRSYLTYTVTGGSVLFLAAVWLHVVAGPVDFRPGGVLGPAAADHPAALTAIFVLFAGGLAVKAALVPLHGWLPRAMVAPAPVSALLHAVAVVKAGAYGIVRLVYDLYGPDVAADLGVLGPLAAAAAVTIIYGSLRALTQDELKRRLAYSTVSQLSYIMLGVALAGFGAAVGGLVHLVHQGIMKVTLFYCAGNLAEELGLHRVSELHGVGRRMPVTMATFTVAALGMIGVPPLAGFVTKWQLGLGGLAVGATWVPAVLVASSLLNAAYYLPIVHAAWFGRPTDDRPRGRRGRLETDWLLVVPPVITATAVAAVGVLAGSSLSPLSWAGLIARQVFGGGNP